MVNRADAFAAKIASLGPKLSAKFHADEYAVIRPEPVTDGSGGTTVDPDPIPKESGRCMLSARSTQGREGVSGAAVEAVSEYTATLPLASIVQASDTLVINGRTFNVVSPPKRAGKHALFTRVELEERG